MQQSAPEQAIRASSECELAWYRAHALLKHLLRLTALCALALLAYSNSFRMGFALDSPLLILNDPRLRQINQANITRILHENYWWPMVQSGLYRPVTTLSYLFNYSVLGNADHAAGYHVVNFLLHAGNICLIYAVALLLFGLPWPAFLTAALWAVHPLGTESVTNLVGRSDELAAMAVLGGLLCYVRSTRARSRHGQVAWIAALFAVAAIGVFSKESAVVLLAVMLLYDVAFDDRTPAGRLQRLPGYAAVCAAVCLLLWIRHTLFAGQRVMELPFVDNPISSAGFWTGRMTAVKVIGRYLWLLLFPWRLSCDYSFNQVPLVRWQFNDWQDWQAVLALLAVGGVLAAAVLRYRRDRLLFFLAGFFFITLLPTSNLVIVIGSIMAERFLYLPSIAFAAAAVTLAYRAAGRIAPGREHLVPLFFAVVLVLCGGRTFARNYAWKDNIALWTSDVEVSPASFKTHKSLAYSLFQADAARNIDPAISHTEAAWSILEPLPPQQIPTEIPSNLGAYYRLKGDQYGIQDPRSRPWYERSVAICLRGREVDRALEKMFYDRERALGKTANYRYGLQNLYRNLGIAYARLGRNVEALDAFRYGRTIQPRDPAIYDDMSQLYLGAGNPQGAAVILIEKALLMQVPGVYAELQRVYTSVPRAGCAVTSNAVGKASLNLDCPVARDAFCTAYTDLVQAMLEARQKSEAELLKQTAIEKGCPAAPLHAVLPEGPVF